MTFEQDLERYAARRMQPLDVARRIANDRIAAAVDEVVSGRDTMHAIDQLEPELRQHAHEQANARFAAGEGDRPDRVRISGLTGGRA